MLMPKKVKLRKVQRRSMKGREKGGKELNYGEFGLQSLESAWITARQLEAARVAITRHLKRKGKLWIRIFPDKPATKKPPETRMGKGKGNPEFWVSVVRAGRIMFEVSGVSKEGAKRAMKLASYKLPIRTRFVER